MDGKRMGSGRKEATQLSAALPTASCGLRWSSSHELQMGNRANSVLPFGQRIFCDVGQFGAQQKACGVIA